MKVRIEKVGDIYFVDYLLSDGSWKNYSSHATYTEALSDKAHLLGVAAEISKHDLFDGSTIDQDTNPGDE